MMRAIDVLPAATGWDRGRAIDRVVIDFDQRHRRRLMLTTDSGHEVLLDLPQAARLRHGDGLVLDDDRLLVVEALPERLLEIVAADADALARLAWHLGNRHVPTQLLPGRLRIRDDHVLARLARMLGADVSEVEAAFDPEPGAYEQTGDAHTHGHGHGI